MKTDSSASVLHIGIPNPMFEGELNMYVIAGDPLTLVDTGIGTPEALDALAAGLESHGLSIDKVEQVILTHKHADHIGLAADIRDRSGAAVYVHEDDWEGVANLDERHEEFVPLVCRTLRKAHVPEERIEKMKQFLGHGRRFARQTPAEKLRHGDTFEISGETLEVIHTPGHTQGCICLRYGNHLFSGDTVLPTISPNIGAGEMRRRGMVQRFLDSLDRVAALQNDDLVVLPGHGPAFSNLAERCAELKSHHLEREEAILKILHESDGPMTVYEIAGVLWKKLPGYHLTLATAEVTSHLEKSIDDGRAAHDDGRYWVI
ncbi:MAG: MBL fold metallo-hydrolase [Planctomycetota bacterium]|nr:MAG: MBL fold metallo-hydrolase [Planctomycetota bacterium]